MAVNVKVTNLSEARRKFREFVEDSQRTPVVIQRHGQPRAVLFGVGRNANLVELITELGKVTPGKKPLAGLRRVRKLSEVLAETRERQKGRPLKSQEEVMAILRKG